MYFVIVQKIDYTSDQWLNYVSWRNCNFENFESVDCHINKILFNPITKEDWSNVHQEDFKTHLIDNVEYAIKVNKRIPNSRIQAFSLLSESSELQLLGYDILDSGNSYSLLTNFGNELAIVNLHISKVGLISDLGVAQKIFDWLCKNMSSDDHVVGAKIVKVYALSKMEFRFGL